MRDDSAFYDHCLSGREKKEKKEEEEVCGGEYIHVPTS